MADGDRGFFHLEKGVAEALPFQTGRFDTVVCTFTLCSVQDPARALAEAKRVLKPGGRLVVATCSLLPEEGEGQLATALERNPGLTVERPDLPGVAKDWWTPAGGLRLRPDYWSDKGGMDGFFMARLRRS